MWGRGQQTSKKKNEFQGEIVFVNVLQFVLPKRGQRPASLFSPLCQMTGILSARLRRLCDLRENNALEFPNAICVCELVHSWENYMSICIDKCSYGREQSSGDCQSMTHVHTNTQPHWRGFCAAAFSRELFTNYIHSIHLLLSKLEREIGRQWELV